MLKNSDILNSDINLVRNMDFWYLERVGVLEQPFVLEDDKEEVNVGSNYRVCHKILQGRDIELVHCIFNRYNIHAQRNNKLVNF